MCERLPIKCTHALVVGYPEIPAGDHKFIPKHGGGDGDGERHPETGQKQCRRPYHRGNPSAFFERLHQTCKHNYSIKPRDEENKQKMIEGVRVTVNQIAETETREARDAQA